MVYNAADQLTAWPGMHTYTYYPDGSLQYEKNAAGTTTLKNYTYTPDGLLSTAAFDGKTLTNTWDADKNRVGFSVNSTNHTFVYDTTAGIPAVVQEDGVYYVREPDGSLIAREDGSNWSYCHFDQLGSTRLLSDGNGTITDTYDYDAYGAVIAHDRFAGYVDQPYQYVGQLGYYTHWQESGFGLLQLGVRFQDAEVGAFTQRDRVNDGLNYYLYVSGTPTSGVDPKGLYSLWDACLASKGSKIGSVGRWKRKVTRHSTSDFLKCLGRKNLPMLGVCTAICAIAAAKGEDFGMCMLGCLAPGQPYDPGEIYEDIKECWDKSAYDATEDRKVQWCTDGCGNTVHDNDIPTGPGWHKVDWWTGR